MRPPPPPPPLPPQPVSPERPLQFHDDHVRHLGDKPAPRRWSPPSGNAILAAAVILVLGLGIPVARALRDPLVRLRSPAAFNVTSATPVAVHASTFTASICVQNTDTDLLRVGGCPTSIDPGAAAADVVSATKGIQIGATGAAGKVFCLDATIACVIAESGQVDNVNVASGLMQ